MPDTCTVSIGLPRNNPLFERTTTTNRLVGKTAIVTGGAVDIRRACVTRIAEEGAKVDLLKAATLR